MICLDVIASALLHSSGAVSTGQLLLSGDEQSGTDALSLSGDEQSGTDAVEYQEPA